MQRVELYNIILAISSLSISELLFKDKGPTVSEKNIVLQKNRDEGISEIARYCTLLQCCKLQLFFSGAFPENCQPGKSDFLEDRVVF